MRHRGRGPGVSWDDLAEEDPERDAEPEAIPTEPPTPRTED